MKIEIGKHGRMSESGSSLLRLIQNQDIPLLDLLVREALQNSLDAALPDTQVVNVDLITGDFQSRELNRHLEKIEAPLNKKYGNKNCRYIAVRDSSTKGLTGPVRYSEVRNNDFGNLLKLVYEISKPQTDEGAGGSWGLGKTIYFRLGIGLVLYYSRIRKGNTYLSRMAACLVEDETQSSAIIPPFEGVKRGIAWWGRRDGISGDATVPIDNETEIRKILSVFNLEPYDRKETGTTIIIPYINEKALLNEVYATNEDQTQKPYWATEISEYLKIAVQRWYAPRLLNPNYPYGAWLSASINGNRLKVHEMLSVFRCIREMYILGQGKDLDNDCLLIEGNVEIHNRSIDLRNVLNKTSAGVFVYAKFSRGQLKMDPPENQRNPFVQITNTMGQIGEDHGPIIMYTRRPGMIVGYDYNGQWTRRTPRTNENEFILGLFVANSNNLLKNVSDPTTGKDITLEEYIRQGEKADHASWTDRNIRGYNPRIIDSIQKSIIQKIKADYSEKEPDRIEKQHIGLGHVLADILLPAEDFGREASDPPIKPPSNNTEKGRQRKKSSFQIVGEPVYKSDCQELEYEIVLKDKPCEIQLQVISDFRRFTADIWEKEDEIGKVFPLKFTEFCVNAVHEIGKRGHPAMNQYSVDIKHPCAETDFFRMELLNSKTYSVPASVRLTPKPGKCVIKGKLSFGYDDPSIKAGMEMKEVTTN